MNETQKNALLALYVRGGEGAIMRNGRILASGEIVGHGPGGAAKIDSDGMAQHSPFARSTWNALIVGGWLEYTLENNRRVRITEKGQATVADIRKERLI